MQLETQQEPIQCLTPDGKRFLVTHHLQEWSYYWLSYADKAVYPCAYHVIPVADEYDHQLDEFCQCRPTTEQEGEHTILVHKSFNGTHP